MSASENNIQRANSELALRIFGGISLGWLAIAGILCWKMSPEGATRSALLWFGGLWLLSVLDITAIGKTIGAVLGIASGEIKAPEKRAGAAIRAFYWGLVKLACLGFFGLALMKADSAPGVGLMLGLGTLVIVPLVGGIVWSQRVLRDA